MNKHIATLLAQHFDIAFASLEGVTRLRELILTLAMQGKLVEQDPKDQPASDLLKEIEAEKERLVAEKKISKQKPLPPISEEEMPYEIPESWEWVRFPNSYFVIGSKINQIPAKEYLKVGKHPVVGQGKNFIAGYSNEGQRLLKIEQPVVVFGDHTRNIKLVDFDFIIGADGVKVLQPYNVIFTNFLFRVMQSYNLTNRGYARHFKVLNEQFIPIPPLEEQHRIVAKIDELMTHCDALEALHLKHEEKRLKVHTAAIYQLLDQPDSKARDFIQQHFNEIYSVPENVAELRKAILQLAVMGCLVPQNPDDPPASQLLEEIRAEKEQLIAEKKIRKQKPLPAIKPEEIPYEIPECWEWAYANDLTDIGTGATPETINPEYYGGHIPWYTSSATNNPFAEIPEKFITEKALAETNCKIFPSGSLIIAMYGQGKTRGQISEIVVPGATNQALAAMVFFESSKQSKDYLKYFFTKIYEEIRMLAEGAAQPNLNVGKIKQTVIPLPPLPEQKRIVAKIDQLMFLCDQLDLQITARNEKQTELLNAIMAQV